MKLPRIAARPVLLVAGLMVFYSADYARSATDSSGENYDYRLPRNFAAAPPPSQPLSFSHAAHAGTLSLPCGTCHIGATTGGESNPITAGGKHMALPEAATCMNCHRAVATDRAAIQRLAEYDRTGEAIRWAKVYSVLKGVNWSHQPHLTAGIDCQICHGEVAQMDVMSVTTAVTAMSSCIGCHRARGANSECETCHAWPTSEQMRQWNTK